MTKIEEIALAIWNKVNSTDHRWEDLAPEERDDALEWARAAEAVMTAGPECICPKCGIRHGGSSAGVDF